KRANRLPLSWRGGEPAGMRGLRPRIDRGPAYSFRSPCKRGTTLLRWGKTVVPVRLPSAAPSRLDGARERENGNKPRWSGGWERPRLRALAGAAGLLAGQLRDIPGRRRRSPIWRTRIGPFAHAPIPG